MSVSGESNRDLLELSFERAMQLDLDSANAGDVETRSICTEPHAVSILGVLESERRITTEPFEAREARLLTGFDAAEEGSVSSVQSSERILEQMRVDRLELWAPFTDFFELGLLIVARRRLAFGLIGFDSSRKRRVVEFPQLIECPAQLHLLSVRWVEAVAEHSQHARLSSDASTGTSHEQQCSISSRLPFGSGDQISPQGVERSHDFSRFSNTAQPGR